MIVICGTIQSLPRGESTESAWFSLRQGGHCHWARPEDLSLCGEVGQHALLADMLPLMVVNNLDLRWIDMIRGPMVMTEKYFQGQRRPAVIETELRVEGE